MGGGVDVREWVRQTRTVVSSATYICARVDNKHKPAGPDNRQATYKRPNSMQSGLHPPLYVDIRRHFVDKSLVLPSSRKILQYMGTTGN